MSHSPRIKEHQFHNGPEDVSVTKRTSDLPTSHPILEQARDASRVVVSRIEETVRSRPLTSLGLAAGIGVLVAFWSKRK